MPLTIEVQNGKVVSISARDGEDVTPFLESYSRSDTIDKLFNIIASAEGSADELEIEYNPTYGFPSSVWIDYTIKLADDEMGYEVTPASGVINFEVLH